MLTTGLDGGSSTKSAASMASSTPGAGGPRPRRRPRSARRARPRAAGPTTPGSARSARPVAVVDDHVGLHPVVGHRQQRHARAASARTAPRSTSAAGSPRQHRGPGDVGGEVPVAEAEPVRPGAVGGQLGQHGERLPARPQPCSSLMPPPSVYITVSRSGLTCRPNRHDVVARVADHGDLGVGRGGLEAAQEAGGADAAGQNGDAHSGSLATRAVPPPSPRRAPRAPHAGGMPRTWRRRGDRRRARQPVPSRKIRPDFPVIPAQQGGHYHVSRLTRGKTRACNFNGVILLAGPRRRRTRGL